MANGVCLRADCKSFMLYDNIGGKLKPFLREICIDNGVYNDEDYYIVDEGSHAAGDKYNVEGDVVFPEDIDLEKEVMCDDGITFLRWYVVNKGKPTGIVFNTDLSGGIITVSSDAILGKCLDIVDDCETQRYYTLANNTFTEVLRKYCPEEDPVYYNLDGEEIPDSDVTGTLIYPEDIDYEQQVMCDGVNTFLRWHVAVKGEPIGIYHDTDLAGEAFTPGNDSIVGSCNDCTTIDDEYLCDVVKGTRHIVTTSDVTKEGESNTYTGILPDGTEFMLITNIDSEGFEIKFSPRFEIEFDGNVDVEFKVEHNKLTTRSLSFSSNVKEISNNVGVAYSESSKQLDVTNAAGAGGIRQATVLAENISSLAFSPTDNDPNTKWYIKELIVYSPRGTPPVEFIRRKTKNCLGQTDVKNIYLDGSDYTLLGEAVSCV